MGVFFVGFVECNREQCMLRNRPVDCLRVSIDTLKIIRFIFD